MMATARILAAGAALALVCFASACGGDKKSAEEPEKVVEPEEPEIDPGEGMVDQETLDSIQRTFARKQTVIARCFVVGVESGEMKKTARGFITVGATISPSGKAENVRILKASLSSKALQQCVTDLVATWDFIEPERAVETSFMYTMERL